ncbi:MAG TPA: response regulator, partial [Gemmatimonadales bacterium]|nr:response regulator [Gemmatimonadales bacterium]
MRHDLRTPVNHIVGYAEMLLEDLDGPGQESRRAALHQAVAAARDALAVISLVLAPTRDAVEPAELDLLYQKLEGPQHRILDTIRALLEAAGEAPTPAFADDLRKIMDAAERLVPRERLAKPPVASDAAAAKDGKARVLVVDDEAGNRDLLGRRLQREGYTVVSAAGGRDALALMARESVDVVLLDVMMPDLDGLAVLERLKADAATRDVPVIMISALDDLQAIARCIEAGALDYLPKPFEPVILRARLAASLAEKRWRDQERETARALGVVTAAAAAVEGGLYRPGQLAEVAQRSDAVGRLARVVDRMAVQVGEREARLKDRIAGLRDEIGVARSTRDFAVVGEGHSIEAGTRLADRYVIESVVGRGGMGTVYRARDEELGEVVALKVLRPEFVADEGALLRFKDEIRLTRRITHRNVVRTHDFGTWHELGFLTMEYVAGLTLRDLIDTRGRLGAQSVLAIGPQLAESLDVAHRTGVIHRDIKPQNLLLDGEGVLKVMDFGVARLAERSAGLTQAGLIVGTPAYMSPEQLTGEEVDARSDLYSVGAVLYECLTGRIPLEAPTVMALFAKVLSEEPVRPSKLVEGIPPALDELVMLLLAKRPEDRVPSAAALAERLQA